MRFVHSRVVPGQSQDELHARVPKQNKVFTVHEREEVARFTISYVVTFELRCYRYKLGENFGWLTTLK